MISRRGFLKGALTAGGIAVVGAELLLPKRTYFLPPPGGWRWSEEVRQQYLDLLRSADNSVRHFAYHNFSEGLDPRFCSVQNAEWAGPDLVTQSMDDLFAYARDDGSPKPLNLDIVIWERDPKEWLEGMLRDRGAI